MIQSITIERDVHFHRCGKGRKEIVEGTTPEPSEFPPGRVPRVSRLMALAIRFEQLLDDGDVADYAELARLGQVTRARITQIMNLRVLAPDIQEAILFLPRTHEGRDPIHLRQLQAIALVPDWRKQRRLWQELLTENGVATDLQNESYDNL